MFGNTDKLIADVRQAIRELSQTSLENSKIKFEREKLF